MQKENLKFLSREWFAGVITAFLGNLRENLDNNGQYTRVEELSTDSIEVTTTSPLQNNQLK